ncbi:hypothetical protein Sango_0126200 [Sesamum angolense]|uniref:DUF538 family protein n=1 Tax=Sesamum angolense TaxID=2727404 RepID=A0AAE1XFK5_9LAMI|nr:hypothetical protein Sango_0126200 [Sesamum angolense]
MDQILNKVGSYWLGQKANKEINSVGDDISSLSTSIEGGAKWLVNKLKGKMQKPLPELLKEYDLAVGIFPRDATNYEFNEETGKLTVYIPSVCEVGYKDSSVLRFSTVVTGYLEKGKLADIEGIKTKVIVWVKVTCISSEKSKLNFTAGMKKSRSRDAYEKDPGLMGPRIFTDGWARVAARSAPRNYGVWSGGSRQFYPDEIRVMLCGGIEKSVSPSVTLERSYRTKACSGILFCG